MKLEATIGFVHPSRHDKIGVLDCDVMLLADERFGNNDYKNQAHALKLMDTELKAAVQRVNDRLKSEGLTKESFIYYKPKCAPLNDEYGNPVIMSDQPSDTSSNDLRSSKDSFVKIG